MSNWKTENDVDILAKIIAAHAAKLEDQGFLQPDSSSPPVILTADAILDLHKKIALVYAVPSGRAFCEACGAVLPVNSSLVDKLCIVCGGNYDQH